MQTKVHYYWIEINTLDPIIEYKLLVLDKSTWNRTTVCKLLVLDKNTWNHITMWKWIMIDK